MSDKTGSSGVRKARVKRSLESADDKQKKKAPKRASKKTPKGKQKKVSFDDLPDDMLCEIFDRLSPNQAMAVRLVNKQCQRCVDKSLAGRVEVVRVVSDRCRRYKTRRGVKSRLELFLFFEPMPAHKTMAIQIPWVTDKDDKKPKDDNKEAQDDDKASQDCDRTQQNDFIAGLFERLKNVKVLEVLTGAYPFLARFVDACPKLERLHVEVDEELMKLLANVELRERLVNQLTSLTLSFNNQEEAGGPNFFFRAAVFGIFEEKEQLIAFMNDCKKLERVCFRVFGENIFNYLEELWAGFEHSITIALDIIDTHDCDIKQSIAKRVDQLETHVTDFARDIKKFDRLSNLKLNVKGNFLSSSSSKNVIEMPELKRLELCYDHDCYYDEDDDKISTLILTQMKQKFGQMDKLDELVIRYFYDDEDDEEFGELLEKMPNITKLVIDNKITFSTNDDCPMSKKSKMVPNESLLLAEKLRNFRLEKTLVNDEVVAEQVIDMLDELENLPELRRVFLELIFVDHDDLDNHLEDLLGAFAAFAQNKQTVSVEVRLSVGCNERCSGCAKRCDRMLGETEETVRGETLPKNLKVFCSIVEIEDEDD